MPSASICPPALVRNKSSWSIAGAHYKHWATSLGNFGVTPFFGGNFRCIPQIRTSGWPTLQHTGRTGSSGHGITRNPLSWWSSHPHWQCCCYTKTTMVLESRLLTSRAPGQRLWHHPWHFAWTQVAIRIILTNRRNLFVKLHVYSGDPLHGEADRLAVEGADKESDDEGTLYHQGQEAEAKR